MRLWKAGSGQSQTFNDFVREYREGIRQIAKSGRIKDVQIDDIASAFSHWGSTDGVVSDEVNYMTVMKLLLSKYD
ncbi:hypothetical protein DTL42_18055 [Bremerella cremea]|uniref:Uncharacterized protein n=1 Tax=Bremerella cremea TaxID=1031537 RepID=A0A368KRH8_9BACT|nr:hypothetical protein DTL42_18055 [Bremerella cremea]